MTEAKTLFAEIRFWIVLFFLIRLFGITNPPLEVAHNWRETTVTMPARNFIEIDSRILYPRIDIAGEQSGITGMEFPLLNYFIYLEAKVFGYQHWYGRLINLIISSFGLLFFFKLIRKYFDEKVAFYSTIILLFSVWFSYSRKIMPDTFSMSLTMIGIYFGSNYLDRGQKFKDLALYFILLLAGILSKLPSVYLGSIYVFFLFDKNISLKAKAIFTVVSGLVLSIACTYYFYWVPFLVKEYGFSHFFLGESLSSGTKEILAHLPETLRRFYSSALHYSGFLLFILGISMAFKHRDRKVILIFLLCFASFLFLVVLRSGFAFYHHVYYIIPFVPVMALIAGYAVQYNKVRNLAKIALVMVALECVATEFPDFLIKKRYAAIEKLEKDLDKISTRQDLILINSGDYPTPMYFAHRKGWVVANEKIGTPGYINELKVKGLRYIVILKKVFGEIIPLQYQRVVSNEDYDIYKI